MTTSKRSVLGPDTDMLLEGLGDALEGKKVLEEPYVDKQTMVRALREQNQIIRMMHLAFFKNEERMTEMEKIVSTQAETIVQMKAQVLSFQDAVEKVEDMEQSISTFKEKVVEMDATTASVKSHERRMTVIGTSLETQTSQFTMFKSEISETVESAQENLQTLTVQSEKLATDLVEMPGKIEVTSAQIVHLDANGENGKPLNEVVDGCTNSVSLLEKFKEKTTTVMDKQSEVMEKLDDDTVEDLKVMSVDFKSLMEWKEEQAGIDLVDIRRSQDSIKEAIDTVQRELFEKIAKEDVDAKLESKFEEIIDHLQSALNSTESDEADFKAVTGNLNQMCESLKSDKADKTEIAGLRKQFLQHQTSMLSEGGGGGGGGDGIDIEEVEEMLVHYSTKHHVDHECGKKVDKEQYVSELSALKQTVDGISQQLLGHANQVEMMQRAMSPGGGPVDSENIPPNSGQWKGLAGGLRMGAGGENPAVMKENSGFDPVEMQLAQGSAPETTVVVSKTKSEKEGVGVEKVKEEERNFEEKFQFNEGEVEQQQQQQQEQNQAPIVQISREATEQTPSHTPRTPLPHIGASAPLNLTSPLQQPTLIKKAVAQEHFLPPMPNTVTVPNTYINTNTNTNNISNNSTSYDPNNTVMMSQNSRLKGNAVMQTLMQNPGPTMDGDKARNAAWAVQSGMELKQHIRHPVGNTGGTASGTFGAYQEGGEGEIGLGGRPSTTPNDNYDPSDMVVTGDQPVKNMSRLDNNPGMSYGGGFQLMSTDKVAKPPLRGLDQSSLLPDVTEKINVIEGSDGRYYVADAKENPQDM